MWLTIVIFFIQGLSLMTRKTGMKKSWHQCLFALSLISITMHAGASNQLSYEPKYINVADGVNDIAIDGQNDIWVANGDQTPSVTEILPTGQQTVYAGNQYGFMSQMTAITF